MIHASTRATGPLAAATAGLLLLGSSPAQSAFARALPPETKLFVSFPDIEASIEEMQQAPIAKMWFEDEVQDFLAEAIQVVESQWQAQIAENKKLFEAGHLPFDPSQLTKLRLHSFSFALTDLTFGEVNGEPMPNFGVILHADLGDSAPIWRNALAALLRLAADESSGEAVFSERKQGETHFLSITPTDEAIPMSIEFAFVDNAIAVSTNQKRLTDFLGNLASGEHNLSRTKLYTDCAQHMVLAGAELETFLNPGAFIDILMNVLQIAQQESGGDMDELDLAGVDRAITALGLRSLKSIGGTSRYEGSRCITESFTLSPVNERRGLLSTASGEIDLTPLRWVPKDAAGFSICSFDFGAIYRSVVDATVAYDPDVADELLSKLAEIESQVGVSVKDDIFEAFGSRVVSWSLPPASFMSPPEAAVIIEVKNQEGLVNALKKIAQMTDGIFSIEENERRGLHAYKIAVNLDRFSGGGGFNPLASLMPTFAFKDGNAVVGFSTSDIKRAIKRMVREDDPSGDVRTNPEFAPFLQQLPASGLQSLSFTDWKTTFESVYQIGSTLLAFAPLDSDIPIDLSLLPDASTLTQHLIGSVSWNRVTDQGFSTKTIGPWGAETGALVIGVGMGIGFVAASFDGGF